MDSGSKKITAILGPTNTGKTHLAVETMLEYESGIIGFPLRLLAREIFDKCVKKVGKERVALITGEEKIIPREAKYFVCTVESMPKDLIVDFEIRSVPTFIIFDKKGEVLFRSSGIPKSDVFISKLQEVSLLDTN